MVVLSRVRGAPSQVVIDRGTRTAAIMRYERADGARMRMEAGSRRDRAGVTSERAARERS